MLGHHERVGVGALVEELGRPAMQERLARRPHPGGRRLLHQRVVEHERGALLVEEALVDRSFQVGQDLTGRSLEHAGQQVEVDRAPEDGGGLHHRGHVAGLAQTDGDRIEDRGGKIPGLRRRQLHQEQRMPAAAGQQLRGALGADQGDRGIEVERAELDPDVGRERPVTGPRSPRDSPRR